MKGALALAWLFGSLGLAACTDSMANLPPLPDAAVAQYKLGPGDQVRVITFSDEQLTGDFRVNDNGTIALPLIGPIKAAGLTTTELAGKVAGELEARNLYKNPSVSVEVTNYRPVFILGEVNRPGQYPYQPGMTVVTAAAVAGGFTYRAIDNEASIVRSTGDHPVEGLAKRETPLQPGDVVTIHERIF
jgi:polysaccharide export outer membrane protein